MNNYIDFGSSRIEYRLIYSDRKTLGITVTPEMEVLVKAPEGSAFEKIEEILRKKAPWILRQQSFFLSFHPKTPARRFVSGETHLYLGRRYQLRVLERDIESVKLKGRFIEVCSRNRAEVESLLRAWYLKNARTKLRAIALELIEKFAKHGVRPKEIVFREMPTRWGSCTPHGKIILSPELIKAPRPCIEYVITHELCHLIHHDHTRKFVDLQTREMPDWERWKRKLEMVLA